MLAALAAGLLGAPLDARAGERAVLSAAAPSLRDASSHATFAPARSLRLARPFGVKAGEVMLAGIAVRLADHSRLTPPAGWRLVRADRRARRERLVHAVYLKVARAREPGSYRWWFARRAGAAGGILAYRGVDARNPVDAHSGRAARAARRRVSAPSLTTSSPSARVVDFFATRATMRTAPPRGATERFDARSRGGDRVSASAAEYVKPEPGATGRRMAKQRPVHRARRGRAPARIGQQIALRPAGADALSPPPPALPPPDLLPPDTTIVSGPSGTTSDTSASVAFAASEPGAAFECRVDGGGWGACTSPTSYTGLADGSHSFEVRARDAAGNLDASPASRSWIVAGAGGGDPVGEELPPPLAPSTGATFHVATTGSDSDPGSAAQPWRTVQKALDALRPSQRAVVHAGTYDQALDLDRACAAGQPCTVEAAVGEARPVLRATDDHVLRVNEEGAYWRFRGFTFRDANITSGGLVDLYGHHLELSGNELTASGDQDFYLDEASHHVQLLGNHMHHSGLGRTHQSHGAYVQGDDHLVANNLIHDHPYGFGIQVYDKGLRSIVVNNTITHNAHSGIVVGGGGGVSGVIVRNNILAYNEDQGLSWDSTCPDGSAGTTEADHNVIFGNANGAIDDQDCPATSTAGGNRISDPLFASAGGRNFHLNASSPAFDYALPEWAPAADHDGNARPQGGDPDAGAYEGG
jgi:hypothetical protein